MAIFDSHAHYCDERFDLDRDELLSSMPSNGVCGIINVPSDLAESVQCIELARKYDFMWAAAGVHPQLATTWNEGSEAQLRMLLTDPKCVTLGETGLDYVVGDVPKNVQKAVFIKQLEIAKDLNKPVIIHDREAHGDTMEILKKSGCHGVMHCFSGSAEMARQLVDMGWYISFPGVVTFKNARKSHEAVLAVPLERILIETDAPYLTPEPFRGKRNDSTLCKYTCTVMAGLFGMTVEDFEHLTAENAARCFLLS